MTVAGTPSSGLSLQQSKGQRGPDLHTHLYLGQPAPAQHARSPVRSDCCLQATRQESSRDDGVTTGGLNDRLDHELIHQTPHTLIVSERNRPPPPAGRRPSMCPLAQDVPVLSPLSNLRHSKRPETGQVLLKPPVRDN